MKTKKYIINTFLICVIATIFICIMVEKYGDNNIKENIYKTDKLSIQNENNSIYSEETLNNTVDIGEEASKTTAKEYPKEDIIDSYKGYEVCAKLEIPIISLETNILRNYSKNSLQVSVTKFWGVEPNQKGNFCVAGHNFINKNMFHNLKKLKLGDNLFLTDKKVGKVEYEIFKIDKVIPEDVSCLDPITNNQREITLITCTNDSKKRIIIKAKEKE